MAWITRRTAANNIIVINPGTGDRVYATEVVVISINHDQYYEGRIGDSAAEMFGRAEYRNSQTANINWKNQEVPYHKWPFKGGMDTIDETMHPGPGIPEQYDGAPEQCVFPFGNSSTVFLNRSITYCLSGVNGIDPEEVDFYEFPHGPGYLGKGVDFRGLLNLNIQDIGSLLRGPYGDNDSYLLTPFTRGEGFYPYLPNYPEYELTPFDRGRLVCVKFIYSGGVMGSDTYTLPIAKIFVIYSNIESPRYKVQDVFQWVWNPETQQDEYVDSGTNSFNCDTNAINSIVASNNNRTAFENFRFELRHATGGIGVVPQNEAQRQILCELFDSQDVVGATIWFNTSEDQIKGYETGAAWPFHSGGNIAAKYKTDLDNCNFLPDKWNDGGGRVLDMSGNQIAYQYGLMFDNITEGAEMIVPVCSIDLEGTTQNYFSYITDRVNDFPQNQPTQAHYVARLNGDTFYVRLGETRYYPWTSGGDASSSADTNTSTIQVSASYFGPLNKLLSTEVYTQVSSTRYFFGGGPATNYAFLHIIRVTAPQDAYSCRLYIKRVYNGQVDNFIDRYTVYNLSIFEIPSFYATRLGDYLPGSCQKIIVKDHFPYDEEE